MACDLQRLVNLPIKEEYKIALLEYFQKPENAGQCEQLSQASDEEILALIGNMDESIAGQTAPPGAGQPPPAQQGIGGMPQAQPMPTSAPPQAQGPVPSPMDMPQPGAPGGINMLKPGGY